VRMAGAGRWAEVAAEIGHMADLLPYTRRLAEIHAVPWAWPALVEAAKVATEIGDIAGGLVHPTRVVPPLAWGALGNKGLRSVGPLLELGERLRQPEAQRGPQAAPADTQRRPRSGQSPAPA